MTAWREIPTHAGYFASDLGQIKGPRVILTQRVDPTGYLSVKIRETSQRVHRLVLAAFDGPAAGREGRHLDGNALNNRLSNLAYGTRSDNVLDSVNHGTHVQSRKTHCPAGHGYDEENTYRDRRGRRTCRACNRAAVAVYKRRRSIVAKP